MEFNYYKTCRTCLGKDVPGTSITFEKKVNFVYLQNLIQEVTTIKLSKNDGLSYDVCDACVGKAEAAQAFKQRAIKCSASVQSIGTPPPEGQNDAIIEILDSDDSPKVTLDDSWDIGDVIRETDNLTFSQPHELNSQSEASFKCNSCHTLFESEKILELHRWQCINDQLSEKDFQKAYCPLCLVSFDDDTQLTKHMWTTHREVMGDKKRGRPKKLDSMEVRRRLTQYGYDLESVSNPEIKCSLCHEMLPTQLEYSHHWSNHLEQEVYGCFNCKNVYLKSGSYNCCPKNVSSFTVINDDMKCVMNATILRSILYEWSGPRLHGCFVCSAIFSAVDKLLVHHETQHPDLSHRCNLCCKEFSTLKNARRHRENCKSMERKLACPVCGLKFAFEISLNKHILRHHNGQKVSVQFLDLAVRRKNSKFLCHLCSRLFSRQDLLDKHSKVHLPEPDQYNCHVCRHKFSTAGALREHIKEHDPEASERNNLCVYCGRNFSNSSNLIVHIRRHTGNNPYKCDFCSKSFPRSSDLQCHRRTHTGERPCVCTVCGKAFSRSNKLARHMRVHTGQKPYKCLHCEKSFSQSNDLKLHTRRHTGEKPYICEVCGERYIQGTALQQHQRTHGHFKCVNTAPKPSTSSTSAYEPNKPVKLPFSQVSASLSSGPRQIASSTCVINPTENMAQECQDIAVSSTAEETTLQQHQSTQSPSNCTNTPPITLENAAQECEDTFLKNVSSLQTETVVGNISLEF